jgi:hypothetical protein
MFGAAKSQAFAAKFSSAQVSSLKSPIGSKEEHQQGHG